MKINTEKYHRDFAIDRGRGSEHVRWTAWRESRPNVKGYGKTEEEAKYDLVHFVQPLCNLIAAGRDADDDSSRITDGEHPALAGQPEAPVSGVVI